MTQHLPVIPACRDCAHCIHMQASRVVGHYQVTWADDDEEREYARWYECQHGHRRGNSVEWGAPRTRDVAPDDPPPAWCPLRGAELAK